MLAAVGFATGAVVTARAPIPWSEEAFRIPSALVAVLGVSPGVVIASALTLVAVELAQLTPLPAEPHHRHWMVTDLLLGALGVLPWLTGAPAGWHWGLSMTGPARSLGEVGGGDLHL